METTRKTVPTLAPLAFSLSIRSESAAPALGSNYLDPTHLKTYPAMVGIGGAAACACLLYTFLPLWLSIPLAVWPGIQAFKYAKRYFHGSFADARIQANRSVLIQVVEAPDVSVFADVAESIVKSQYGNQQWAEKALQLRGANGDSYLFLAAVFTFAPELWQACAKQVYDRHLSGATPHAWSK